MKPLLLRGCDVLTLDEPGRLLRGVSILIEDGVIQNIGPEPADHNLPSSQIKDVRGCLAMPGFWNAKAHVGSFFLHGAIKPPVQHWLERWLQENTTGDISRNQVCSAAYLHACQSIRNGVVGFGELSPHLHDILPVTLESGLKASLGWSSLRDEWDFHKQAEDSLEWAIANNGEGQGRIRTAVGYRGLYLCSDPFVARLAQRVHEEQLPLWLDLPDHDSKFLECTRTQENDPVALLQRKGAFGCSVRLNYITHLEHWNIKALQHKSVQMVMNPSSRVYRTQRKQPWQQLLELGLPVAIGVDPSPLNRRQSVLRELHTLLWEAEREGEVSAGFHETLLRLGTVMGAWVLGFEDSGWLAPGMAADIALVNTDQPHFGVEPLDAASLLERMQDGDIHHLLCNGRWLLRNGELETLDEERILWEARRG